MNGKNILFSAVVVAASLGLAACSSSPPQESTPSSEAGVGAQPQGTPQFVVDATWPRPYPNKWKIGGVTGLAVDKDDNVWVYNRPNDLTSLELQAERTPPIADCCTRPPSMILI